MLYQSWVIWFKYKHSKLQKQIYHIPSSMFVARAVAFTFLCPHLDPWRGPTSWLYLCLCFSQAVVEYTFNLSKQVSEFKATMVYRASSRVTWTAQRNAVSKTKPNQTKNTFWLSPLQPLSSYKLSHSRVDDCVWSDLDVWPSRLTQSQVIENSFNWNMRAGFVSISTPVVGLSLWWCYCFFTDLVISFWLFS